MALSFDQWLEFIIALSAPGSHVGIWQFPGNAGDALNHSIHFCLNPHSVLAKLATKSAQRLFDIFPRIDGFGGLLSFEELPLNERLRFADSHVTLFKKVFASGDWSEESFMWWERLIGAQWDDGTVVQRDRQLCDHMLVVFEQILEIPSESCQRSALHGLHEFGLNTTDPERALKIVSEAIALGCAWSDEIRSYAESVLNGTAQ